MAPRKEVYCRVISVHQREHVTTVISDDEGGREIRALHS